MGNRITAAEANRIAKSGKEPDKEILSEVYTLIEIKAVAGLHSCSINYNTRTRTIMHILINDGFSVNTQMDRNEQIIMIRW